MKSLVESFKWWPVLVLQLKSQSAEMQKLIGKPRSVLLLLDSTTFNSALLAVVWVWGGKSWWITSCLQTVMGRGRLWSQREVLSERRRRMFKAKDGMGWGEKKGQLLINLVGQQLCISGYGCRLLHWERRTVPWKVTGLQLLKMSSSDWENKCCLYYISDTYITDF